MLDFVRYVLLLAAALLLAVSAYGDPPEKPPSEEVTVEEIQSRLKQLDEAADLDDAIKGKLREVYQQTLQELEAAKTWTATTMRFEQMIASAADELASTKSGLAGLPTKPKIVVPAGETLVQLQQALSTKEAEAAELQRQLSELEAEPRRRAARRVEIPKLAAAAQRRLADAEKQLAAPGVAEEPPQLAVARRTALLARRQAAGREVRAYEKETAAYDARAELLPLRLDLATRQAALAQQEMKAWREVINRRRQEEAQQQARRAAWEAHQAEPAVHRLAEENAQLAEKRTQLAGTIAEAARQLDETALKFRDVKEQFSRTQEKVDTIGLTNCIGLLLRQQREMLPNLRIHRRNVASRQATIRDVQLELFRLADRRQELADLERQVRKELHNLGHVGPQPPVELEAAIREALETEKEYLDALISDYNSYSDKLIDLDSTETQLIEQTEACANYIDERVLWIRSAMAVSREDLRVAADALAWLAGPESWKELGRLLAADLRQNPALFAVSALGFVGVFCYRRRMRARMIWIGEMAGRAGCYRFAPTLEVLLLTGILAAVWPCVLGYVAWRLVATVDGSDLARAVSSGLLATSGILLLIELLRETCRSKGLAGAHFCWPVAGVRVFRRRLRWLSVGLLPSAMICFTMLAQGYEPWRNSLGRLAFVAGMVMLSLFVQRAFRQTDGILQPVMGLRPDGWIRRSRFAWYWLSVLAPLALAGFAAAGYYYTAQQLSERLYITLCLLLGLTLLRALLLRWVLVNRRKLAIEQARQRRAAALAESKMAEPSGALLLPVSAETDRDLAMINTQTRRLIGYSLALAGFLVVWLIWVDVLPALSILDRVELWQTSVQVTETYTPADGVPSLRTLDRLEPITLAGLCLALLIAATTFIAARNIPGLLEMAVLQHLPVDAGFRYAVAAVSRYVITIVGLVLACSTLGIGWSKVQWLVAAVSVGLGFGLQEIFANFVSGLIILFERPVRVGDVVTVADVSGVVSRIRMRATTITNWDRKEFIVPNKEFITGRLLNWTLSDQVNRVVVNVGIAYGSDTQLAHDLLLRIAQKHPQVLADPPPVVTFDNFGSSSLNFVLRCFLASLEHRLAVTHELHMEIDRAFRASGIEIAFPQQDVHIRSVETLMPLLQQANRRKQDGDSQTKQVA